MAISKGQTFHVAKILISCDEDVMYKLQWDGEDISPEVYVSGGLPFADWFPWNNYPFEGDGVKQFVLLVKFPAGGAAGTCYCEMTGEEADVEL